jgi:hypothetical protein
MRVLPEYARFLIFDLPLLEDIPKIVCHDLRSFYHANMRIHTAVLNLVCILNLVLNLVPKFSTKFSRLKNLRWLVKRSVLLSVRLTLVTPTHQKLSFHYAKMDQNYSTVQSNQSSMYEVYECTALYTEYKLQILTRMHDACR